MLAVGYRVNSKKAMLYKIREPYNNHEIVSIWLEVDFLLPSVYEELTWVKDREKEGSEFFVYIKNKEIIGTVMITGKRDKSAFLEYIAVKEQYRGQGCGREMLENLFVILKGRSFETVNLESKEKNKEFYEKVGFTFQHYNGGKLFFERKLS
jgi:ribosomal protein S18 acetylase RimI-like enzyme